MEEQKRRKIGILGGTFNPIHYGHLLLAQQALEILALDRVLFMPSGNSYMKQGRDIASKEHRAKMIELAIEGQKEFSLSDMELMRTGPTYTCDTVMELKIQYPNDEFYFIMGADSLLMLESWKNPEILLENCVVAAAVRGTGTEERLQKIISHLIYEYHADIRILPARFVDLSSSEIRERIYYGRSVRYMLPDAVLSYIEEQNLYHRKDRS